MLGKENESNIKPVEFICNNGIKSHGCLGVAWFRSRVKEGWWAIRVVKIMGLVGKIRVMGSEEGSIQMNGLTCRWYLGRHL